MVGPEEKDPRLEVTACHEGSEGLHGVVASKVDAVDGDEDASRLKSHEQVVAEGKAVGNLKLANLRWPL